jgi:hypothetical protein
MRTSVSIIATIQASFAVMDVVNDLKHRFYSRHDHTLIAQLMSGDCGGISKMTADEANCFRTYARSAICRLKDTPAYIPLRYRLEECFPKRPYSMCKDLFQSLGDGCKKADEGYIFSRIDDDRLLKKLGESDCGGLSRMTQNVEGCFRKYVWDAIDHWHSSDDYLWLVERFTKCFGDRPELPCDDGIFRTDVFA